MIALRSIKITHFFLKRNEINVVTTCKSNHDPSSIMLPPFKSLLFFFIFIKINHHACIKFQNIIYGEIFFYLKFFCLFNSILFK